MKDIKIYTLDYCPFCKKALELLFEKDINFERIDITLDEEKMIDWLKKTYNLKGEVTLPQIIVNNKTIGGYSDLKKLDSEGKLDKILK